MTVRRLALPALAVGALAAILAWCRPAASPGANGSASTKTRSAPREWNTATPSSPRPRWLAFDDALAGDARALLEWSTETVELDSGLAARVSPTRPRFFPGAPGTLQLELVRADGTPASGRTDLRFLVLQRGAPGPPAVGGFVEDIDQPGRYTAMVRPGPRGALQAIDILVDITERGDPSDPGESRSVTLSMPYDAEAYLEAGPLARRTSGGIELVVRITARERCSGGLRAELRDGAGTLLEEVRLPAELPQGISELRIPVGARAADASDDLYLVDATLFSGPEGGMRWADAWPGRRRVIFTPDAR